VSARTSGATRILLYNWPIYAVTWGSAVVASVAATRVGGRVAAFVVLGAVVAATWAAISLVVSHYIYDRSALASGSWVTALLPARAERWASIDAGLDAEVSLDGVLPDACVARLDIYDPAIMSARSVQRARAITARAHAATSCPPTALALGDASCDLIAVIFTAHELRDARSRERLFLEVKRALRSGGRMLLVEHVRDAPNFAAFGPGFMHFLPRAEWLRLARFAGFRVAAEMRITPWVLALALEGAP
jgi:SAM-dependent methyltransferase